MAPVVQIQTLADADHPPPRPRRRGGDDIMGRSNQIYEVLRGQHAKTLQWAKRLEDTARTERDRRSEVLSSLRARFEAQRRIELDALSPLLHAYPQSSSRVGVSDEENRQLFERLIALERMEPDDPQFQRQAEVFHAQLAQHIHRVEREVLPEAQSVLSEEQAEETGAQARRIIDAVEAETGPWTAPL